MKKKLLTIVVNLAILNKYDRLCLSSIEKLITIQGIQVCIARHFLYDNVKKCILTGTGIFFRIGITLMYVFICFNCKFFLAL